jgi:hypothetical protein
VEFCVNQVSTTHPYEGEEQEMTTAFMQSQEKPRLHGGPDTDGNALARQTVGAAATKKPRGTPARARSTKIGPNIGTCDAPTPLQSFATASLQSFRSTPTPEPSSTAPDPQKPSDLTPPEHQAIIAKRAILPAAMASAMRLERYIDSPGHSRFLDDILKDAGSPSDPVETMLLKQLALCHLRAAQLHGHAGQAVGLEAAALYNAAAARLTAEFRKTALALKRYRGL